MISTAARLTLFSISAHRLRVTWQFWASSVASGISQIRSGAGSIERAAFVLRREQGDRQVVECGPDVVEVVAKHQGQLRRRRLLDVEFPEDLPPAHRPTQPIAVVARYSSTMASRSCKCLLARTSLVARSRSASDSRTVDSLIATSIAVR
ncbi:MAG: hypothetical protein DLM57_11495 [Pseudonocardiales bacterium]|nr:MAG: hypothetical protein DLM57_11495 [Pseudonocardiales bacterium]